MDIALVFHHLAVGRVNILPPGFVLVVTLGDIGKRVTLLHNVLPWGRLGGSRCCGRRGRRFEAHDFTRGSRGRRNDQGCSDSRFQRELGRGRGGAGPHRGNGVETKAEIIFGGGWTRSGAVGWRIVSERDSRGMVGLKIGELLFKLVVFQLQLVHGGDQIDAFGRIFNRLRRQAPGEFTDASVDALAHLRGERAVRPQREVLLEMVDGRERIIDVLLVEQPDLELRFGSVFPPLVDDLEKSRERFLVPAGLQE